jgi:hypothetical protein
MGHERPQPTFRDSADQARQATSSKSKNACIYKRLQKFIITFCNYWLS